MTDKSLPKVLVVDDQPKNLHSVERILETLEQPVEVVTSLSGVDALSLVIEHDFVVILMDVQMPEMNGFETAQFIHDHKKTSHIPIIFLTAINKSEEYILEGYKSGAVDYMFKPVEPAILRGKVSVFVDLWYSRQEILSSHRHLEVQEKEIRHQKKAVQMLHDQLSLVMDNIHEGVVGINSLGEIVFSNIYARMLLGYDEDYEIDCDIQDFVEFNGGLLNASAKEQLDFLLSKDCKNANLRWIRNSIPFYVECKCSPIIENSEIAYVIIFQDISEQKRMHDKLEFMANYDELTRVANRNFFNVTLEKAINRIRRSKSPLSLLYIDLDNFKPVNDLWGHNSGDELLQQVCQRMSKSIREGDMIARLGGDEFAAVLFDIHSLEDSVRVAKEFLQLLSKPFELSHATVEISASIGISNYEGKDDTGLDELLTQADQAMYHAKKNGKNQYFHYQSFN